MEFIILGFYGFCIWLISTLHTLYHREAYGPTCETCINHSLWLPVVIGVISLVIFSLAQFPYWLGVHWNSKLGLTSLIFVAALASLYPVFPIGAFGLHPHPLRYLKSGWLLFLFSAIVALDASVSMAFHRSLLSQPTWLVGLIWTFVVALVIFLLATIVRPPKVTESGETVSNIFSYPRGRIFIILSILLGVLFFLGLVVLPISTK